MKTLHQALDAFNAALRSGHEGTQIDYNAQQCEYPRDPAQESLLAGKLYGFFIYDHFVQAIDDHYVTVSKSSVQKHFKIKMTDNDFDDWIADNADWFRENRYLPDRAADFPALIVQFEGALQGWMQTGPLRQQAFDDARNEISLFKESAFLQGLADFRDWIRGEIVPSILPETALPQAKASAAAIVFTIPAP